MRSTTIARPRGLALRAWIRRTGVRRGLARDARVGLGISLTAPAVALRARVVRLSAACDTVGVASLARFTHGEPLVAPTGLVRLTAQGLALRAWIRRTGVRRGLAPGGAWIGWTRRRGLRDKVTKGTKGPALNNA